jgi:ATP-dependent RNA helicase DDX27
MAGASASSIAQRAVSAGAGAAAVAAAASSMSASSGSSSGVVRDLSKVPTRVSGRPARVQFSQLNLSKPLLRAVADLGFSTATPVQAATIPVALTGSDVLANAVTGSGKTAAFMLPILERLLYRPRRVPTTRVVVLTPTRELAAQCHSMTENLARYTDIRVCLIVGGLSPQVWLLAAVCYTLCALAPMLRFGCVFVPLTVQHHCCASLLFPLLLQVQEAALRQSPDIIVATPGRLIDHLRNSQSVHLEVCGSLPWSSLMLRCTVV